MGVTKNIKCLVLDGTEFIFDEEGIREAICSYLKTVWKVSDPWSYKIEFESEFDEKHGERWKIVATYDKKREVPNDTSATSDNSD